MEFVKTTIEELETELGGIRNAISDVLEMATKCVHQINKTIYVLKKHVVETGFDNSTTEKDFFKNHLPRVYSWMIFYCKMVYIETRMPPGTENRNSFLERELKQLALYYEQYPEWVLYYKCKSVDLDEKYFLRSADTTVCVAIDCNIVLDERFSTLGTYPFSMILASEMIQTYIEDKLLAIKHGPTPKLDFLKGKPPLRWTGSKSDLIELLYALHSSKLFNENEYLDVRQIANWLETTLHVKLGNYYRVFQGIRIRKKNRTQFLDNLKENLVRRMDDSDEHPRY